jgi:O-antigen ligase
MKKVNNIFKTCTIALIYILALMIPFGFIIGPVSILLFVCWIFSGEWKLKWENLKSANFLWIWMAFFLLNLLSLCWTANMDNGLFNIQVKLLLFILPIGMASFRFDVTQTRRLLGTFIFSLTACGLFMLTRSIYVYFSEGINTFYYQDFCHRVVHPAYLSMYFCTGIMILFHGILLQNFSPKPWKISAIILCLFFAVIIFLLSSKLGLISMILLFGGYIVYSIIRFKRYFVGIGALLVLAIGFFVALKAFPQVGERINNMKQMFTSHGPINPAEVESNQVRFLIWEADAALIERHPLGGVGVGDAQDSLLGEYQLRGMTGAYHKNLNAHSQIFQTGIEIGIPGLILLLLLFVAPVLYAIRRQYGFLVLTASLILLNIAPESMFEAQAGVVFAGFFYSLILFSIDRTVLSPMKAPPIKFPL